MKLLPTLRAYLYHDGHHSRTAEQLFIGVTTLKYRLSRISELLGADLRNGDVRFQLQLEVRLNDFLEAQGA